MRNLTASLLNHPKSILLGLLVATFLVVSFSHVRYTGGDARGSLLLTNSILDLGTIKLDAYGDELGYRVERINQHYYYFFPIGSSIAAIPFVVLAKGWGIDVHDSEFALQIMIAAFVAVMIVFLLFKIARFFLTPLNSVLIAGIFWFGTSFASTGGTALWSQDFATLFALAAIYLVVRATKQTKSPDAWVWLPLGLSLFFAFLCRPTLGLLWPCALLFLFSHNRKQAIFAGLLCSALFGFYMTFNLIEIQQLLPNYFLPTRLERTFYPIKTSYFDALEGHLLSPSRGLIIYSPFLVVAWLCRKYAVPDFGLKRTWLLIGLAWPVIHVVLISTNRPWWAGHSFGSRYMMDVLPGLFLLTLRTWPTSLINSDVAGKIAVTVASIACAFSIWVNTWQALFNPYPALWNSSPDIDRFPEYLIDWRFPQFIYNQGMHERRLEFHAMRGLKDMPVGQTLPHDTAAIAFIGWSEAERTHRWSSGYENKIAFQLREASPDHFQGIVTLDGATLGDQKVRIALNGNKIFEDTLRSFDGRLTIHFDPRLLHTGINTLVFQFPEARRASDADLRLLAFLLRSFALN
jgi:Dolichyl-phosphate-mannose-protein mannosyltransferase